MRVFVYVCMYVFVYILRELVADPQVSSMCVCVYVFVYMHT